MAMRKGGGYVEGAPKKTRQGAGSHTKYAASSRNKARKKYRGQGKGWWLMMIHRRGKRTHNIVGYSINLKSQCALVMNVDLLVYQ